LVTKADAIEKGTTSAACLYHQCNQSTHVTDGITVTLLSASLQYKTSSQGSCMPNCVKPKIVTCCPCQIAL